MKELIILRLEGILQSWGENSKWNKRTTARFPTKSAITGMIGCAMGLPRESAELAKIAERINLGIRADRIGSVMNDYQTVQGMPDLYTADGKKRNNNTLVTPREYLCDASFLVVIETEEDIANSIINAFNDPVWPIYLGRKNCIPSRPVLEAVKKQYTNVFYELKTYPKELRSDLNNEYEIDQKTVATESYSRADLTVGFRRFRKRTIWHGLLKEVPYVSDKS